MTHVSLQYPIFGPDIQCPHCRQTVSALTLTDTYLCPRHGAFEADPHTGELVHLQSGRHWRLWKGEWYRQHTHPDGIRFEIHEALDRLYTQGFRATRVIIASRYRELICTYLERTTPWSKGGELLRPRLYGLPVEFGPDPEKDPQWDVINFSLEKEPGMPTHSPYSPFFE
ncbi:TIGR02652 family protein [Synechococcales cyanobacterium C]|uniref:TIGR02652 family protein n=1 Tax=Petrachloros mirabilis ULC683 TaxID=2781853 RepID=A0A8K2A7U9_9CYAN|nr:TIGR02652 family protein [Petrachloros mirabilis]NCJ07309.1 TIGR02652 family protein [Petrachloros mirabilis ULC683]